MVAIEGICLALLEFQMEVKWERCGNCMRSDLRTMSGQHGASSGKEASTDLVVPLSQVVRLEDLQWTLQAMVSKAINDHITF